MPLVEIPRKRFDNFVREGWTPPIIEEDDDIGVELEENASTGTVIVAVWRRDSRSSEQWTLLTAFDSSWLWSLMDVLAATETALDAEHYRDRDHGEGWLWPTKIDRQRTKILDLLNARTESLAALKGPPA